MSENLKREHKNGKHTGYETDGERYWLAPMLVEQFGQIQDQERALDAIIEATVRTVAEARRHNEAQRRRWWDAVYNDLGLDKSVDYSFKRIEGVLAPPKPENKG